MNKRTKFLLVAMSLVGVAMAGDQGYRRLIEQPAAKHELKLAKLQKQISQATDLITDSAGAADQLLALENCSLPFDDEFARARYQDWLLGLVQHVDLKQASVDAGPAVPFTIKDRDTNKAKEIYQRYTFSLRGRGDLQQVTRLLYEFYQGGHLQKIRSLSLNPLAGGQQLDVTISVEAIGLTRCEREAELSTVTFNRLAFDSIDQYEEIVRRNIFARDLGSSLTQVVLTAVTFGKTGLPEAWFSVGSNQPTKKIQRGESINFAAHTIEVLDIQPNMVVIDVDGAIVQLQLGKSVQEAATAS